MVDLKDIFKFKKVMIVAEIGINHNGIIDRLFKLVEKAKLSNADAVKFQIFSEELFYIPEKYLPKDIYQKLPIEIFKKAYIPFHKYKEVFDYSKSLGILPFATPLDLQSFEFLTSIEVEVFKVASSDITYVPLLKRISKTKKPCIISTGFSNIDEVDKYVKLLKNNPLVVMFCVSRYPSTPEDISIKEFIEFKNKFEDKKRPSLVGFSDHTKTTSLPIAMVTLGARVVEKHLTLDENDNAYDNAVSISPEKFKVMVEMIREVEISLSIPKRNLPSEFVRKMSVRSLVSSTSISKDTLITEDKLEALRPGIFTESSIKNWNKIINKKAHKNYSPNEPI